MPSHSYQQESLAASTGIELIIALYDAMIRFLYRARDRAQDGDIELRRAAVKRVVDILMYLQARLRTDIGGTPAVSLADFYAAMFTLTLEASHYNSPERFESIITCVRNVRDAWVIAARDPQVGKLLPRELRTREERFLPVLAAATAELDQPSARWSA